MNLDSQHNLIRKFVVKPKKTLGQHFVIQEEILDRIVECCGIERGDTVVEIGAGLGGLTRRLAACAQTVLALEKDWRLANLLKTEIITDNNVKVIHQDAFEFDYQLASSIAGRSLKVVGNLPYNIASRLTIELLRKGCIEEMCLMFQKEVADRITAAPGGKDYGFFTIIGNLYAEVEHVFDIQETAFYPRPKVQSSLIRFRIPPSLREPVDNEKYFASVVKIALSQRRKKLRNALKTLNVSADDIERVCSEINVDSNRRSEALTVKEFAMLSNRLLSVLPPLLTSRGTD
jgi:16S rRNA (adenine1518-N6/adenine1519-N6)-dimethyltransferase